MPQYVGGFAKQVCRWIWGEDKDELFVSMFSGGETLIASSDKDRMSNWKVIEGHHGLHAEKRIQLCAEEKHITIDNEPTIIELEVEGCK